MTVFRCSAALLALALVALPLHAQVLKTGASKTLGGAAKPGGKLLTRDELRACLKTQTTMKSGRAEIDRERATLEQEKAELAKVAQALKTERSAIQAERNAAVAAYNARVAEFEKRGVEFVARNAAYNDMVNKRADKDERERQRAALEAERAELMRIDEALKAEAPAIQSANAQAPAPHNGKAAANDQKIDDWTKRNAAFAERANAWQAGHDAWSRDCAERRYDEADEIAIQKGK